MSFWLQRTYSSSISHRLLVWVLIVSSLVTTVLTGLQLGFEYLQDMKDLESNLQVVEEGYAESLSASVWEMHMSQIQPQLDGIIRIPGVQAVRVMDDERVIAQAGVFPPRQSLHRNVQLLRANANGNAIIGQVQIYANVDQIWQKLLNKMLLIFITQFVKTLIVSFGIYFVIQQLLTRHLVQISQYLKVLQFESSKPKLSLDRQGTEKAGRDPASTDELDVLVDSINDLQAKVISSHRELRQINQHLEDKVSEKTALIIDQRQKLEYTSKMSFLGEMAGGVSHEINGPLSTMRGNNDLLLKALDKTEIQKDIFRNVLQANQATIERMTKVIRDLRTFSRDGSRDPFLPTPIETLVQGATSLCREKFRHASVELRVGQLPADVMVSCRSTEIRQVLLNLLNNSFDAVQRLNSKWIQIDFAMTEKEFRIMVTDSGCGLPVEIQDRMFQPFFSTKDVGKGTGLGLSVSQGIVENHGGVLMYDGSHNNTRFILILPRELKVQ